ncbi:MAG TPA: hypothetical protein PKE45_26160, partial [Caldilineaceae bacterium]|nr:hypothetical protein [Caldilineaceae bacterium]
DALEATPADVRQAVGALLAEPSYRRAAMRMAQEIAALPEPAQAIPLLERLVAEKRPIYAT